MLTLGTGQSDVELDTGHVLPSKHAFAALGRAGSMQSAGTMSEV